MQSIRALLLVILTGIASVRACTDLIITGVIDGPVTGGVPKAIELFAPVAIANLSLYGVGSANNGAASTGIEFTFPSGPVAAGSFLYLATETEGFNSYFGFDPTFTNSQATNINGNDVLVLFKNGAAIDVYGDLGVDGTGEPWEYTDSFAYRKDGETPSTAFQEIEWTIEAPNSLDGETTNDSAAKQFPIGSFSCIVPSQAPSASFAPTATCSDVIITGVIDGPLSGGVPKAIELFAPFTIPDLSIVNGVGSANNGAASKGPEYSFPAVTMVAGSFFYLATETAGFNAYFGFDPTFTDDQATNVNGNDVIELFKNNVVIDVYGDVGVDGTGEPWEYLDSFAYRVEGSDPSPSFILSEWSIQPPNTLDGETSNDVASHKFPIGRYSCVVVPSLAPSVSSQPSSAPSTSFQPTTTPKSTKAPASTKAPTLKAPKKSSKTPAFV